jgi:hypothetical protein
MVAATGRVSPQGTRNETAHATTGGSSSGRRFDPIRVTVMIKMYYTREQPDDLQRRERGLGAWTLQQTEREWSELIAMLELVQRWQELIDDFTGEDAQPPFAAAASPQPAPRAATGLT